MQRISKLAIVIVGSISLLISFSFAHAAEVSHYEGKDGLFVSSVKEVVLSGAEHCDKCTGCAKDKKPDELGTAETVKPADFSARVSLTSGRHLVLNGFPCRPILYEISADYTVPISTPLDVESYLKAMNWLGYDPRTQALLFVRQGPVKLEGLILKVAQTSADTMTLTRIDKPPKAISAYLVGIIQQMLPKDTSRQMAESLTEPSADTQPSASSKSKKADAKKERLEWFKSKLGLPGVPVERALVDKLKGGPIPVKMQRRYPNGWIYSGVIASANMQEIMVEVFDGQMAFPLVGFIKGKKRTIFFVKDSHDRKTLSFFLREEVPTKVIPGRWIKIIANNKTKEAYQVYVFKD